MGLHFDDLLATLDGQVTVEEAEPLAQWLVAHPGARVDLSRCAHLHAAALQTLLALRPVTVAAPADRWLAAVLAAREEPAPC